MSLAREYGTDNLAGVGAAGSGADVHHEVGRAVGLFSCELAYTWAHFFINLPISSLGTLFSLKYFFRLSLIFCLVSSDKTAPNLVCIPILALLIRCLVSRLLLVPLEARP